jgi:hypothetical protein
MQLVAETERRQLNPSTAVYVTTDRDPLVIPPQEAGSWGGVAQTSLSQLFPQLTTFNFSRHVKELAYTPGQCNVIQLRVSNTRK